MKLSRMFEEAALNTTFEGQKALMQHGYTAEITNTNTAFRVADRVAGKELLDQGYEDSGAVEADPAHPDQEPKRMYIQRNGGLGRRVSGSMSFTANMHSGSTLHSGYMNTASMVGQANAQMQASVTAAKLATEADLYKADPNWNPADVGVNYMVPLVNPQGKWVNWRYMMKSETKDNALERDNRFEHILGVMAGTLYDKQTNKEQNKAVINAIKEDYDKRIARDVNAYVLIGPKSADPEMREIWDLLPDHTKSDVHEIWGSDGMWVRGDSVNILFGYRKYSLANIFAKDPGARKYFEKVIAHAIEGLLYMYALGVKGLRGQEAHDYSKRAAMVVMQGEGIWQELVKEMKDIIVIKSGVVLIGNVISNFSLLYAAGVPAKDILRNHLVAWKGAIAYDRDSAELYKAEQLLSSGYTQGNSDALKRRIAILKDALERNPVKMLIDEGLKPTIVEDVSAEDDIYSFGSILKDKTQGFVDKLNPKVVAAAKVVYMAHDTKVYGGLRKITQLSDFVARYTLYQHTTTRSKNKLSHDEAILDASDSFINYDIPMHQGLQYMDDMGFMMFTKYLLRIQKVLLKLFKEHPLRVISMGLLDSYINLGPIVTEMGILNKIPSNPFEWGAVGLPASMDEIGWFQIWK